MHSTWLAGAVTEGVGFTVILKVTDGPVQETLAFVYPGIIVMVATTGVLVLFVAVNTGMLPVPLAASPMEVLLFVHENVVPVTAPVKLITADETALQRATFAGCTTVGVGFIVMVNVLGKPGQAVPPFE